MLLCWRILLCFTTEYCIFRSFQYSPETTGQSSTLTRAGARKRLEQKIKANHKGSSARYHIAASERYRVHAEGDENDVVCQSSTQQGRRG